MKLLLILLGATVFANHAILVAHESEGWGTRVNICDDGGDPDPPDND